jgi:hypothetical protein
MYIYIDETGPFDTPKYAGHSVCAVGALAIPESCHDTILESFSRIVAEWHLPGPEPKGRLLTEGKFDRFFAFLGSFDVVLSLVAIDMGMHTDSEIVDHKERQVALLRQSVVDPIFFQSMRDSVNELADRMARLSIPLYVQATMLTNLLGRSLQTTTLHFAQTEPTALGSFRWRIDAKDAQLTPGEQFWKDIVKPMIESYSLRHPLCTVNEFDYSAMETFANPVLADAPDHLRAARPGDRGAEFHSFDARKIVDTDMAFAGSHTSPGLQLVDIATSALRRACQGTLKARGWRGLGNLTVRGLDDGEPVAFIKLGPTGAPPTRRRVPYSGVYEAIARTSRDWEVKMG